MTSKLIEGMSNADYHAHPAVSSSQLKTILRSPAHFYAEYLAEVREPKKQSPDMLLGSIVHVLFLEPHMFDAEYALLPEDAPSRPTSAMLNAKKPSEDSIAKIAWWDEFNSTVAGRTVITHELYETAATMAESMRNHPLYDLLIDGGIREASIFYNDIETGLACRIRPDWHVPPDTSTFFPFGLMIDVKKTGDARPEAFSKNCANYGYALSAAQYCDGYKQHYKCENDPSFLFFVVEDKPPFATRIYNASDEMLFYGNIKKRTALHQLAICLAANEWPAYLTEITDIHLPKWTMNEIKNEDQ